MTRTGVSSREPAVALVDEWLAELVAIVGAIEGAVDPRFVDGVLVSTQRS